LSGKERTGKMRSESLARLGIYLRYTKKIPENLPCKKPRANE